MELLRHRDLSTLLSWSRGLYELEDLEAFPYYAITSIKKAIGADSTIYTEFTLEWQPTDFFSESSDFTRLLSKYKVALEEYAPEHPLISNYTEQTRHGVYKISDFTTKRQLHRLGIYNNYYRYLGVECQIAFETSVSRKKRCTYVFNRGRRDFCERDRMMLNVMKPYLIQTYRTLSNHVRYKQILSILEKSADSHDEGVVLITSEGKIELYNKKAKEFLEKYFECSSKLKQLPDILENWLNQRLNVGAESKPLLFVNGVKRLVTHLIYDEKTKSTALLMKEDDLAVIGGLDQFNLTQREVDVMSWVSKGKTNQEIGIILCISPRTVQKHLENIYTKLGVETRTAAAMALTAGFQVKHTTL